MWKRIEVNWKKLSPNNTQPQPILWIYKKSDKYDKRVRCVTCNNLTNSAIVIRGWLNNYFCPDCWKTIFKEKIKPLEHFEQILIEEEI